MQRKFAVDAKVTEAIEIATYEATRAVGSCDRSYLSHAPNLGTPMSSLLDLSTTYTATFLIITGLRFLRHIEPILFFHKSAFNIQRDPHSPATL